MLFFIKRAFVGKFRPDFKKNLILKEGSSFCTYKHCSDVASFELFLN